MAKTHLASGLLLTLAPVTAALADNPDIANKSNNPLSLAPGLNLQDYYTPRVYDSNIHTNDALLRGALPVAPNDFIGVPQLLRATLPISTRPDPRSGYSTGMGDLTCSIFSCSRPMACSWASARKLRRPLPSMTNWAPANGKRGWQRLP